MLFFQVMKNRILLGFLGLFVSFSAMGAPIAQARSYRTSASDVYVHGYTRKDGTYVSGYYRSAPDGIVSNNYSCIDNGKCGGSISRTTPAPSAPKAAYVAPSYSTNAITTPTQQPTPAIKTPAVRFVAVPALNGYLDTTDDTLWVIGSKQIRHFKLSTDKSTVIDLVTGQALGEGVSLNIFTGENIYPAAHRVKVFADGSKLDLDTMQPVK
jgi:hypothetical protein